MNFLLELHPSLLLLSEEWQSVAVQSCLIVVLFPYLWRVMEGGSFTLTSDESAI